MRKRLLTFSRIAVTVNGTTLLCSFAKSKMIGFSAWSSASWLQWSQMTESSTKITNPGALKNVLGVKRFLLYLAFVMAFSLVTGLIVNLVI